MNFFFVITLAVAAASTVNLPLKKLLANPKLFAAAFANADNDAIGKMITLVDQLVVEGQDAKTWAVDDHQSKDDTHNSDVTSLSEAESALATASGNLDVESTNRDGLTKLESDHRSALGAAVQVLTAATDLEALTNEHWSATSTRVAEEKESFGKIIELLEGVSAEGRRLLSSDEADPTAVDAVIAKVNELLAVGDTELADSTTNHDAAVSSLADATAAEAAARVLHTGTAGALAASEQSVITLSAIKATKTSERNSATSAEAASALALSNAQSFKDAETDRVNKEDASLKEVKQLLEEINN